MSQEPETTITELEPAEDDLPPLTPDPQNPTPGSRVAERPEPEAPLWTPENPNCPQCGKPFKSNRALKVHLRQWCKGYPDATDQDRPDVLRIAVGERKARPQPEAVEVGPEPEIPPLDLTVTPESVAKIMATQGMLTNQFLAPGTIAWLWTQDEIDLIAPAAARMASRSTHAAKIAENQDAAAVVLGSAAYVVRNVQGGGIRRGTLRASHPVGRDHSNDDGQVWGDGPQAGNGGGGPGDAQDSPGDPPSPGGRTGGGIEIPDVGPKRGWPG